ncbi:MAG: hypothetical protein SGCHY_003044 [Lobulomycetales sp.]
MERNQLTTFPTMILKLPLTFLVLAFNQITELPEAIGDLSSLTQLHMDYCQISTIPQSIGKLSQLTHLRLLHNQITTLPETVGNLRKLVHLFLNENQLTNISESIGNLSSLEWLDVSGNQLTAIPKAIGKLTSLSRLELDHNLFTEIPDSMADLSMLQALLLNNNKIEGRIPSFLSALPALVDVYLENNMFSGPIPNDLNLRRCRLQGNENICAREGDDSQCADSLPICPYHDCFVMHDWMPEFEVMDCCQQMPLIACSNGRIVEIHLNNSGSEGPVPEELEKLTGLRVLNLAQNAFNASIPESLSSLANLTHLLLNENDFSGQVGIFGNFSKLESLNVSNNRFSGIIPAEIGLLNNLTSFDPSNNQFSGMLPPELTNLPDMKQFYVFGNALSGEVAQEFSEWLVEDCNQLFSGDSWYFICANHVSPEEPAPRPSWTEVIIDIDTLPNECFSGIQERCMEETTLSSNYTCNDADVSRNVIQNVLVEEGLQSRVDLSFSSSAQPVSSQSTYVSNCANGSETSWTGTATIIVDAGIVEILQTPSFTSFSFLSFGSFSTSSVQFACVLVNGDEVEFSAIVGGIVAGQKVTESQYNCKKFLVETVTLYSNSTTDSNTTTEESAIRSERDEGILLIAEYVIVAAYILISYAAAFVALRRRRLQKSMSDFKVFLNSSFSALFLVWGTGNLAYTVLFSLLLDEFNFFYIKSLLTLTYFFTYYGFVLIIHYR